MAGERLTARVLHVDDDPDFRAALRERLAATDVDVVGEAVTGEEALQLVRSLEPHVVLMDLDIPGCGGIEATRLLTKGDVVSAVVILSESDDEDDVIRAVAAGASGYLLKTAGADELAAAVRAAAAGDAFVTPCIAAPLLERIRAVDALSARELDVLRCLARGLETNAIAAELALQPQTVKNIVGQIMRKLGVRNRVEAAVYALRIGLWVLAPSTYGLFTALT